MVRHVVCVCIYFFFQAEDGIRDLTVTGVQTCALPISLDYFEKGQEPEELYRRIDKALAGRALRRENENLRAQLRERYSVRSEERRVGKECRSRWSADH